MSEQYSQQYAGAAKAATEGELKGAAASAQQGELKGAAARSKGGERMGGAVPIGEKNVEASDPDYVPKAGEQATQEELAGADYESGAVKGPLQGAPARAVERQTQRGDNQ